MSAFFQRHKYNDPKVVAEMSLEDIQRINPTLSKEIKTKTMTEAITLLEEKNARLLNSVTRTNRDITKHEMDLNKEKINVLEAFKFLKSGEKSTKKIEGSLAEDKAANYLFRGDRDVASRGTFEQQGITEEEIDNVIKETKKNMEKETPVQELERRLAALRKGGKSHKRKKGSSKRSRRKRSSKRSKRKYAR